MEARGSSRAAASSSGSWDCSICTFTNTRDAFKCGMCEARKGTSTRKVRQSDDVVAQQQAAAALAAAQRNQELAHEYGGVVEGELRSAAKKKKKKKHPARLSQEALDPVHADMAPALSSRPIATPEWSSSLASQSQRHTERAGPYPAPASLHHRRWPRLSCVDRSSSSEISVTACGFSVDMCELQVRPMLAVAPMCASAVSTANAVSPAAMPQFKAVGLEDAQAYAAHKKGVPCLSSASSEAGVPCTDTKSATDVNGLEAHSTLPDSPEDCGKSIDQAVDGAAPVAASS